MKPPGNGEAALGDAATPEKLTGLLQSSFRSAFAQVCPHTATGTERLPGNHAHYAREVCKKCGHFVRWVPSPQSVQRRRMNVASVARLLTIKGLTSWEVTFLRSLSRRKKFSPKQEAVLDRIYREFFGAVTR